MGRKKEEKRQVLYENVQLQNSTRIQLGCHKIVFVRVAIVQTKRKECIYSLLE